MITPELAGVVIFDASRYCEHGELAQRGVEEAGRIPILCRNADEAVETLLATKGPLVASFTTVSGVDDVLAASDLVEMPRAIITQYAGKPGLVRPFRFCDVVLPLSEPTEIPRRVNAWLLSLVQVHQVSSK